MPASLAQNLKSAVVKSSILASNESAKEAPVDTSALRQSIGHQVSGLSGSVEAGFLRTEPIKYAKFVHEGTGRYAGDPKDYGRTARVVKVKGKLRRVSGAKGGIKPNRFFERAANKSRPQVLLFFEQALKKTLERFKL